MGRFCMDDSQTDPDTPLSAPEVWLRKAREDLPTAAVALEASIKELSELDAETHELLRSAGYNLFNAVGHHAQRAVEKALKAALVAEGEFMVDVRKHKHHSLVKLRNALEKFDAWDALPSVSKCYRTYEDLTFFASDAMYPDGPDNTPTLTAESAVELLNFAKKIVNLVDAEIRRREAL